MLQLGGEWWVLHEWNERLLMMVAKVGRKRTFRQWTGEGVRDWGRWGSYPKHCLVGLRGVPTSLPSHPNMVMGT